MEHSLCLPVQPWLAAIVVRHRMIERVAWEGAMAVAEVSMVGSWDVYREHALVQEMLMVVGCRTADERRHKMAWHLWMVALV